jgi:hypothetical protein
MVSAWTGSHGTGLVAYGSHQKVKENEKVVCLIRIAKATVRAILLSPCSCSRFPHLKLEAAELVNFQRSGCLTLARTLLSLDVL